MGTKKIRFYSITLLAALLLFAGLWKYFMIDKRLEQPELRVFTRYVIDPSRLEPASYGEASEYDFISYIYSPLVQFDNQGQIIGGLADRFYWKDSDLIFEIREGAKTSEGQAVTADDVMTSFKRYHILQPTQATQFFAEVCLDLPMKSLEDPCPGMVAEGNRFILKFKSKKPLYLDIFTSPDFSIVPSSAIDRETLKVVDPLQGTGPYRLLEVNKEQSFLRLEARRDHWLWKKQMPQKVFIKTFLDESGHEMSYEKLGTLFFNGAFDLIPTYTGGRPAAKKIREGNLQGFEIYKSNPISTYILFFSERAKAQYSVDQRLAIAEILRTAYYTDEDEFNPTDGATRTNEFFPPASEGSLTPEQKATYEAKLAQVKEMALPRTPVLHVVAPYMSDVIFRIKAAQGRLAYENDETYTYPPNADFNQRFDGFFSLIGSSSIESADSIYWIKAMKWMPYPDAESDRWIQSYMETEDKGERVKLMKKLHFDMLMAGMVAPIKVQEYAAVIRKPWKFNFSKLFTSTPLWQIEYDPELF